MINRQMIDIDRDIERQLYDRLINELMDDGQMDRKMTDTYIERQRDTYMNRKMVV